jgi:tetratricopeptide (TPR) repeat protein
MVRLRLAAFLPAALLSLASTTAAADAYYYEPPPPAAPKDDFWREVVAPHGDEIQAILQKAQMALQQAAQCTSQDCDATGEGRTKLLDDVYGMLRYARKLDPRQTDVLNYLGWAAEESGRASAAVEAYQAYFAEMKPDATIPGDIHVRIGRAYLRLGRSEDAIRHFRSALQPGVGYGPVATAPAYLGLTLMNEGRIGDAIDELNANVNLQQMWGPEPLQAILTLVVAYDRDEQISAAFQILDSMQNQLSTSYSQYLQMAVSTMVFVPAHDQHYYLGLVYESQGYFAEARNEWLLYSQAEGAPYRGRALDHVAAIDKLQAEKLVEAAKAARAAAKAAKKKGGATSPPPTTIQPSPWP